MPNPIANVAFLGDAQVPADIRSEQEKRLALIRGPIYIHIYRCKVIPTPSPTGFFDKPTIKKGSMLRLRMYVNFSELLGDLEADYVAEFHCHNIATCECEDDYCVSVKGNLKCNHTWIRIFVDVPADKEGIFSLSCTFHLPKSELFDYCCHCQCFAVYDDQCEHPECHTHHGRERIAEIKEG